MNRVSVVTDSTATLDPDLARERGITIVPITVIIGEESFDETDDPAAARLAAAMASRCRVTTARPTPERFIDAFQAMSDMGAESIVCATLSSRLSATWESAELAARAVSIPVSVVDSRSVAMGLGYAVLRGADAAASGAGIADVAAEVQRVAARSAVVFCVDNLEHLRRGGRIGGAAALIGQALQVKPLLEVVDGEVTPLERVRTTTRALDRLGAVAMERAGGGPVDIAVQHLGAADRAEALAQRLSAELPRARISVRPVGASLAVHAGPGLIAVVICPQ